MPVETYRDPLSSRPWQVIAIGSLPDLVKGIAAPSAEFILLVAADTSRLPPEQLVAASQALLAAGARYVCCWGPGCARLHDVFDECAGYLNNKDAVVMTTSHDDEQLEEVIWFATHSAFPDVPFSQASASVVVLVVGNTEWYDEACRYLGNGALLPDEA